MKNIILFVLINIVSIGFINSQTRQTSVFDNFAINNGVNITASTANGAAQLTASQAMAVNDQTLKQNNNQSTSENLVKKTVISTGRNALGFTTGDVAIDSYIVEYSTLHNVDPLLIYAQMHQESGFKRRATSYKGASGLMQLMPGTAARFGVSNIYDAKQNINAGIKYMRWLMDKFGGNVNLALAGYNAGEGAVMKYGNQIPPYRETQAYVKRISSHYSSIKQPVSPKAVTKPVQQAAIQARSPQSVSTSKFEQRASAVQLSNGKTVLSNF